MKKLTVEVITPSKSAYKGEVTSVTIPGTMGNFQVLYNHAPLMSSFEIGKVKIVESPGSKALKFATSGGTVEVLNNIVLLLAESFESPEEIDIKRAKEAEERAKERIAKRNSDKTIDSDRAELALRRAINRIKVKS